MPISASRFSDRRAVDTYFIRLDKALTYGRQALLPSPATFAETAPGTFRGRWTAACLADLAHARNDWARLVTEQDAGWCQDEQAAWGAHPSERHRLPHEWAAAAVVGVSGHLLALEGGWRAARRWQPGDKAYLRDLLRRRRVAWTRFLAGVEDYRAVRP
jgi:hypothetical protein